MQPQDPFRAQLATLTQGLVRSEQTMKSPAIAPGLYERVSARFGTELARLRKRAEALRGRVAGAPPLEPAWRELRELQRDGDRIFEECLALVQGGLARGAGIDDGVCALTDALLDDLAAWSDVPWGRFTLLATSEFYRDTAEIIRIRYPDTSLWAMPFAAHEFGHFAGPQLRATRDGEFVYPFQEKLRIADESRGDQLHTKKWYHLQEQFADVFAAYTLGPAYVAAFVTLRSSAAEAQAEDMTHPAAAKRVHAMLAVLRFVAKMEGGLPARSLESAAEQLSDAWSDGLRAVDPPVELAPAAAAGVSERVDELLSLLCAHTPPELAFGRAGWLRAEALAEGLLAAAGDPGRPGRAEPPAGTTRRDILNAAWYARFNLEDQTPIAVNTIADRALAAYRRLPPRGK